MTRPRCKQCAKPAALRATLAGQPCKRCVSRLPPHLLLDPDQPRPNADPRHRPGKRGGAGIPPAAQQQPARTSPRGRTRQLQGR